MVEYKYQTFRKVLFVSQLIAIAECFISLFLSNSHLHRCIFTSRIRYNMSHILLKNQVECSPNTLWSRTFRKSYWPFSTLFELVFHRGQIPRGCEPEQTGQKQPARNGVSPRHHLFNLQIRAAR